MGRVLPADAPRPGAGSAQRGSRLRGAGGGARSPALRRRGRRSAPPTAHLPRPASSRRGSRGRGAPASTPALGRRPPHAAVALAPGPRRSPHRPRSRPPGASSMGECGAPGRASPCRPAGLAASAPARGGARARGIAGRPGSLGRGRINGRAGPAPSPRQAGAQPAASFGEGLLAVGGRRRSRNQGCGGPNCAPCRGALHHPFPWPCKLTGAGSLFPPFLVPSAAVPQEERQLAWRGPNAGSKTDSG